MLAGVSIQAGGCDQSPLKYKSRAGHEESYALSLSYMLSYLKCSCYSNDSSMCTSDLPG